MKMQNDLVCDICPHNCVISPGQCGFCGGRANVNGKNTCVNYGCITSAALDPVEKKPLKRYKPGSFVLSIGSFGCNFKCPFCQNHGISMLRAKNIDDKTVYNDTRRMTKEIIAEKALELASKNNIGIAYTYNEPLISYEFIYDTAQYIKEQGMDNIVVTNGCIYPSYFEKLLPFIDAFNIDLKTFNPVYYKKLSAMKNALDIVKSNIILAFKKSHVELTCLIIPNENDSPEEMEKMCEWTASISPDIPLHITRFFPNYKYLDKEPSPINKMKELEQLALKKLRYVYLGNVVV